MESFAGGRGPAEKSGTVVEVKPLSSLREGQTAVVSRISGAEPLRVRLVSMGIVPGRTVQVISGRQGHPFLIGLGVSRVMIGWGMAGKIMVESGSIIYETS